MEFYSNQSRQKILERLHEALKSDTRISGALLVGSGAYGFKDELSDIDLAVVVSEDQDTLTVFKDWRVLIQDLLPVLWCFTDIRGAEVGLYGFILNDFLEVDISFQSLSVLSARSPNWTVLFDRTSQIEKILHTSWLETDSPDLEMLYIRRLDSIWYYITHVAVSIKCGHLWRAIYYLEEIRNRTIELEGLICNCQTHHFREVDQLPRDWLIALEQTIPTQLSHDELVHALRVTTDSFFETAAKIDRVCESDRSSGLKKAMSKYLSLITF